MKTKPVLITGCSSGIGLKAAELLHSKGYRVFATARKTADVEKLKNSGFESCTLDVEDSASIKQALDYILSKTQGQIYGLVNNAGVIITSAVEDLSRDELRRQFEINVFGLLELTNLIMPVFRKQGFGRIINISSVVGRISLPYGSAYSSSKFALESLTDALRWELSGTNIYVSIVEPGPIKTKFSENAKNIFEQLHKGKSFHARAYQIIQDKRKNKNRQDRKYPPDDVVKKILHALESRHPRARYPVTPHAYLIPMLKRFIPDGLIDLGVKQSLKKYKIPLES